MSKRGDSRMFLRNVALMAVAAAAVFAAAYFAGLRLNETSSLPPGIWRVHALSRDAHRGEIVTFCPPDTAALRAARDRGYLDGGVCPGDYEPLFKPVVAVEGDHVDVDAMGVSVNGRRIAHSAPVKVDGAGRALPALADHSYIVAAGSVWVVSSYTPWSFDSRYFGPIATATIAGSAVPIWTSGTWSGLAMETRP